MNFIVYRVFDLEIDCARFMVSRKRLALSLEPQIIDLIIFLIEERHRMVSSDELLKTLWRGRVVVPSVLRRAICLARKALKHRSIIRTVHGRGYQWVAPVDLTIRSQAEHSGRRSIEGNARVSSDFGLAEV
jgi:DNA-binding winged helix-turn-helix (wHTH) protein